MQSLQSTFCNFGKFGKFRNKQIENEREKEREDAALFRSSLELQLVPLTGKGRERAKGGGGFEGTLYNITIYQ